jgi:putative oxidoreductase
MTNEKGLKRWHIALWIVQGFLALMFGYVGLMKIVLPAAQLMESDMSFANFVGIEMTRFIGVSELLGAMGLILPAALRIKPILTPLAASGIALVMILATAYHAYANEPLSTIAFFLLAAFVAWGRYKKVPIEAK